MTITIPSGRTIALAAKDGGGFQSAGIVDTPAATILEQSDFSSGSAPGNWFVSTQAGGTIDFSNGYSRGTYPITQGNAASHVNISIPIPDGVSDLFIQFRARMPGNMGGCKFCKVHGIDNDPVGYANATFGLQNNTGLMRRVLYGADGGDASSVVNFSGSDHILGRADGIATVSAPQGASFGGAAGWGSAWHDFRIRCKFNSGDSAQNEVADGAFYVEIDGDIYMDATNLFNRNYQNGPIEKVTFFNAAQNDDQSFIIDFDDIIISTGGFA